MLDAVPAIVLALGLLAVWVGTAQRQWRGTGRLAAGEMPPFFPFSDPVWRGVVRSFSACGPFVVLLLAGGAAAALAPEGSATFSAAMAAGFVGLTGFVVLHVSILFLNRPRFLVPPALRDEPGALAAWRRQRRCA